MFRTTKSLSAAADEGAALEASLEQLRAAAKGLGDIPLIVLTKGKHLRLPGESEEEMNQRIQISNQLQEELAEESQNSRWIIVENSGHGIPFDDPQSVIDAVRSVVVEVRPE